MNYMKKEDDKIKKKKIEIFCFINNKETMKYYSLR